MNFFAWILFGLIAGGIAKFIMPGKDPGGCLITSVLGIVGSLLGGVLGRYVFDFGPVTGFNLQSFGIAILGSVLLLMLFRIIFPQRGRDARPRE